jgi:transposase
MYDKTAKDIIIKIYKELPNYNINGKNRKTFINNVFEGHINTIYNWLKNINILNIENKNCKYTNRKITKTIEFYILNTIKKNTLITIKKIRENIINIFGVTISKQSIYSILKQNNITYKFTKIITNPYTINEQKEQMQDKKK